MVWDAQLLQPNAHRKAFIQSEPYEGTHSMGSKKCHNLAKIYCSKAKESSSSTMSLKALETVYYLADKVMYPFFEL
jgi:hypothetical protein